MPEKMQNETELDFDRAIEGKEFVIWCQPQYNTVSKKMTSGEALVRWQTSDGEIHMPSEFIPELEENGRIERLDEYVFTSVCLYQKELLEQGFTPLPVSVNISRVSLSSEGKVQQYKEIIERFNVPKRLIPIEITESATLDNEQVRKLVDDFISAGFSIHMDDFGSGYSSLANLGSTSFSVLKLDKGLIDGIGTPRAEEIIRHIITLAHFFNTEVVAEGVEYRAQYTLLKKLECDTIQGYYFSKPVAFAEFIAMQTAASDSELSIMAIPLEEREEPKPSGQEKYAEYKGLKKILVKMLGIRLYKQLEKTHFKGEQNEIYQANVYAMRCMGISLLVLFFCWILDVLGIFIVDLQIMNTAMIGAVAVFGLSHVYARLFGIDKPNSRYAIIIGMVVMYSIIFMELAYHTMMLMVFPLICSMLYFDKKITRFSFVATCIGFALAVMIGVKIGLCDANMLLLTYTNSTIHSALLESGDFTINSDRFLMFLFFVFPRWLLMMAIMPMLNHLAVDIQSKTQKEAKIKQMAEMDGLTGVYNRFKYVQDINNYYPLQKDVAVLYFDINNLKVINDTKGHECGDKLICALSETMMKYESDKCHCYRIGGDEFLMILENENAGRIETIKKSITGELGEKVLEEQIALSVAMGFSSGTGSDIEAVIHHADEDMYRNKFAMKKTM